VSVDVVVSSVNIDVDESSNSVVLSVICGRSSVPVVVSVEYVWVQNEIIWVPKIFLVLVPVEMLLTMVEVVLGLALAAAIGAVVVLLLVFKLLGLKEVEVVSEIVVLEVVLELVVVVVLVEVVLEVVVVILVLELVTGSGTNTHSCCKYSVVTTSSL
jgi:hypothetical protein